ncbi:nitrate reductase associated protein [Gloeobacter morelensis]|uniref:Nitrate reductase maturation protein NarM n=1 Tax=Gloeobacter morelensis MG652769 TaxID=2781736 RepID=A0ABY3PLP7_9CYAN|nr:nitrate reductase associated protein [Gloeobacter morelensis]UFP94581.1 nitrate reductase maturation protein NarM [Gloeobacter morelensis MG652769]
MHPDALLFFEQDFWPTLDCMPMGVRYKLDLCATKVSLRHWQLLATAEREELIALACENGEQVDRYRERLGALARQYDFALVPIDPDPAPWQAEVPRLAMEAPLWRAMNPFERFVCLKAQASSKHAELLPRVLALLKERYPIPAGRPGGEAR